MTDAAQPQQTCPNPGCGSVVRSQRRRSVCVMTCPPVDWRWITDSRLSPTDEIECCHLWHDSTPVSAAPPDEVTGADASEKHADVGKEIEYRIDVASEKKSLKLPGGRWIETEASDCEIRQAKQLAAAQQEIERLETLLDDTRANCEANFNRVTQRAEKAKAELAALKQRANKTKG